MIKFQKRYFVETLENNETNSGQKHMPHVYSSRFQKHLYDESALSRFEVLTNPLYKCNEDRPIMLHNTKTFSYKIAKDLILTQANFHLNSMVYT